MDGGYYKRIPINVIYMTFRFNVAVRLNVNAHHLLPNSIDNSNFSSDILYIVP